MPKISILNTDSYDLPTVQTAVAGHFDALGFKIPPGARVVVKPNLIMRCTPQRCATTHPVVIEAVIRQLQSMGAGDITIADSPGGLYTPQLLTAAYEQTGMAGVAKRCGVKLNTDTSSRKLRIEDGKLCREFDIISPIADADIVVNVCKLKTHCMTTFSCGVKNLFGCVPGLLKPELHYRFPDEERFARMLVDLSLLVRPAITVVDGIDGMEGDGPTGGTPRHAGITAAAGYDALYSLDLVLAGMIGLPPESVMMLTEAMSRGLCPPDASQVEILGDPVPKLERFVMPASKSLDFTGNVPRPLALIVRALKPILMPKPKIRLSDCIGCGKCAESCPAKTIAIENRKAHIDLSNCIRCFCCHEMCPVKAIDIKTPRFFEKKRGKKL